MLGKVENKNRQNKKIKAMDNPTPDVTTTHSSVAILQAFCICIHTFVFFFPKIESFWTYCFITCFFTYIFQNVFWISSHMIEFSCAHDSKWLIFLDFCLFVTPSMQYGDKFCWLYFHNRSRILPLFQPWSKEPSKFCTIFLTDLLRLLTLFP